MNEIELYSKLNTLPDPMAAIDKGGEWIAKSGFFGVDRVEAGKFIFLACLCERMTFFQYLRTYDTVQGKPRKKALAMLAEFRAKGGKHKWIATGDDGKAAEIELTIDGQSIRSRFTIEDATRGGLVRKDSAWEKSPANMMRARAISNGVAMLCPEIVAGSGDGEAETPLPQLNLEPPAEKVVTPLPAVEMPTPAEKLSTVERPTPTGDGLEVKFNIPPEDCDQIAQLLNGNMLKAALWLMKNLYVPKDDSVTTEDQAVSFLGKWVPRMKTAHATRILKNKDSFLRAIQAV